LVGGVFPATEGIMKFDGKNFNPKNPKDSQDAGIGLFIKSFVCVRIFRQLKTFLLEGCQAKGIKLTLKSFMKMPMRYLKL